VRQLWVLGLIFLPLTARADEKDDALAMQKETAAANWKKMNFKDAAAPVETANLIVYARLPEAKTKALAANLDKFYAAALKPLKYGGAELAWPGKLAVYILPDRSEFVDFMRKAAKQPPGEDQAGYSAVNGDVAFAVIGAARAGTAGDLEERARAEVGAALLRKKMGGGDPPEWLTTGFARATTSRVTKPTAKATTAPPVAFRLLWEDEVDAKSKAKIATYLIDYLAYGPAPELFPEFVGALKSDETTKATWMTAYEAIKMDEQELEAYARAWKKKPAGAKPAPTTKPKKDKP
jgi:hypothetical protein